MKQSPNSSHPPLVLHARMMNGTGGGPDKTIINSPRFLKPLGFECICVFYRPPNDKGFETIRKRAVDAAAEIIEIDDGGILDFSMIRKTIRLCRHRNVTIWHGHDYKTNLLGWIVSKFHPMRLVTTAHGWVDFSGRLPMYYQYEKRWILPRYEKVICVSSTVMDEAIAGGTPESKCWLIENAIDSEQFARQRTTIEAKKKDFGLPEDCFVIGAIGRLSAEKGFDLLIKAAANLIAIGIKAHFVIAGEGSQKANLQAQIDNLGLNDHFTLLGFCQDTRSFYESLDTFILSSHREGLPNVVLEAMSVGVPVIATNVDGVPKIIRHGVDGMLIPPGDAKSISHEIRNLISDPVTRQKLSEEGTRTVRNKWSFGKRMNQVSDVYVSMLQD